MLDDKLLKQTSNNIFNKKFDWELSVKCYHLTAKAHFVCTFINGSLWIYPLCNPHHHPHHFFWAITSADAKRSQYSDLPHEHLSTSFVLIMNQESVLVYSTMRIIYLQIHIHLRFKELLYMPSQYLLIILFAFVPFFPPSYTWWYENQKNPANDANAQQVVRQRHQIQPYPTNIYIKFIFI